jgi:hypothetical protein
MSMTPQAAVAALSSLAAAVAQPAHVDAVAHRSSRRRDVSDSSVEPPQQVTLPPSELTNDSHALKPYQVKFAKLNHWQLAGFELQCIVLTE